MAAQTPLEGDSLMREKAMWQRRIDRLVCNLYGLTADEIATVEEATRSA